MASRANLSLAAPMPSPSNSPPPRDPRTQFSLVNSLWLDSTASSFTAAHTPAAIVEKVRETGRFFEKAVMASGAADGEKAALCSMWQHYDSCFSDILHSLLQQVKVNRKLVSLTHHSQSPPASASELPPLKSPALHSKPASPNVFKRAASLPLAQAASPKLATLESGGPSPQANRAAAARGRSQAAEEALVQLEGRLKREQEEREVDADKAKKKIDMLEADKRHLKIEVANLEQVVNAQLHVAKGKEEADLHFKRSDYHDLPVADLLSIQTKSQEVEQTMLDVEKGFGEGEDLLLRLNFMMRKLRTDETLRAGGADLDGVSLDIVNAKLRAELTVAKRQISALQRQHQDASDRVESLEKILANKKAEFVLLVSQLNGVSMEEAEEMVRNKGNSALTEGIAKQNQSQTKVYEGRTIRVQPMPSGRWPSEIAVTIERFGIDVAVQKYGAPTIDKFMAMSILPPHVAWDEDEMPMGHSVLRAMVACAQGNSPLVLKQLAAQVQALVAKMQTAAETAVEQRAGEAAQREESGWGRAGSAAVLGALGKLKRRVDVFRSCHESADERRAASLKFVAKALDPKASATTVELLHEVSVVMNLKMRMDEEHSVMLQQQLIESRMTGAMSPFLCPILQAAPPSLAAVCTMYYSSITGRRSDAVACVKALADGARSHRGSHWRLYFYSILTSMDAQSVKSYSAFAEADRKGTSVRALTGATGGKSSANKPHDVRSATAGAAAAASPTTTSLQFFSYALRLLTAGHGFLCVSEAAHARMAASGQDAQLHDAAEAQKQNVEMRALKELLDRDSFLAENIGVVDADQVAELQRQLLLESSHINSASSTHVTLDDVLRGLLDRYMAHQARLAALVKASFKEATARHRGDGREYDDIITAIHANVPMDSVAAAMRSAVLPKYAVFHTVISSIIPGLGESRIMQLYDIMSLLFDAWPDRSVDECFAEAARYCGIVHAFLLQAAHSEAKQASQ